MTMEECEDWMQEKALKMDEEEIAKKAEDAKEEVEEGEDFVTRSE